MNTLRRRVVMPRQVHALCSALDAWIVGSSADPDADEDVDIDVMVSYERWRTAAAMLPDDAARNALGGMKFTTQGRSVDVFPGTLEDYFKHPKSVWAWQPNSGLLLKVTDFGRHQLPQTPIPKIPERVLSSRG